MNIDLGDLGVNQPCLVLILFEIWDEICNMSLLSLASFGGAAYETRPP